MGKADELFDGSNAHLLDGEGAVEPRVIPTPVVCTYCGEELDEEQASAPRKDVADDIICDDCYRDEYEDVCELCGNIVETSELECNSGEIIAVWSEAPGLCCKIAPGYYRVKHWPIYADGMIEGYLFPDAIEKVMDLDEEGRRTAGEDAGLCGALCETCRKRIEALLG